MPRILREADIAGFRERLCETATRIVVERGPDGFSMRLLASRMGVSAMTPYRYFKDKEEILSAIRAQAFDRFAGQLEAALATEGASGERSAAVGRAYVRFAMEEPIRYRLMFDLAQPWAEKSPDLAKAEARARAAMTDHVRLMIADGVMAGDPVLIGHVFWASLHGAVVLQLAGKLTGEPDFQLLLAEVSRVVAAAYRVRNSASA